MKLADCLLSLVLEPAEASAVVGDLLEESPQRGRFWFWRHVTQALLRASFHELTRKPLAMVGLGFECLGLMNTVFVGWMIAMFAVVLLAFPHHILVPTPPFLVISTLPGFCAGAWAATRAPGREFAVATVSNAVAMALFFGMLVVVFRGLGWLLNVPWTRQVFGSATLPWLFFWEALPFALSALSVRFYRLYRGSAVQPKPPAASR